MSQTVEKVKKLLEHPLLQSSVVAAVDLDVPDAATQIAAAKAMLAVAKIFEEKGESGLAEKAVLLAHIMVDEFVNDRIDSITELT